MHVDIPRSHPRYHSLIAREKLVNAFEKGIVVAQGLIAHGRGECFDYILGEKSHWFAVEASKASVAWLLTAKNPVISVNGNYAALAAEEIRDLQEATGAIVEINIFYRTEERVKAIEDYLRSTGVRRLLGSSCAKTRVPGLESPRGIVCVEGIGSSDFVLLAMEDGDRTEALVRWGKTVAAIDLNPFSRTAQKASITIVDEAVRATRLMVKLAEEMSTYSRRELEEIKSGYDNRKILSAAFKAIMDRLREAVEKGVL